MRVAIFPARGGSQRIPGKNIRPFSGRPMIAWPLEVARTSGLFDHIVVSTDDDDTARIAAQQGAEVPFRRPAPLADDHASTDAVLAHALDECVKTFGPIAQACCIYPTAVMLRVDDLVDTLALLVAHGARSAFPVVRYDFPIEQALVLDGVRPVPRWPGAMEERSQDLREHFHDAGLCYWIDAEKFARQPELFSAESVALPIPSWRAQDINTADDWVAAEMKFRMAQAPSR